MFLFFLFWLLVCFQNPFPINLSFILSLATLYSFSDLTCLFCSCCCFRVHISALVKFFRDLRAETRKGAMQIFSIIFMTLLVAIRLSLAFSLYIYTLLLLASHCLSPQPWGCVKSSVSVFHIIYIYIDNVIIGVPLSLFTTLGTC